MGKEKERQESAKRKRWYDHQNTPANLAKQGGKLAIFSLRIRCSNINVATPTRRRSSATASYRKRKSKMRLRGKVKFITAVFTNLV